MENSVERGSVALKKRRAASIFLNQRRHVRFSSGQSRALQPKGNTTKPRATRFSNARGFASPRPFSSAFDARLEALALAFSALLACAFYINGFRLIRRFYRCGFSVARRVFRF